ncbi:MAG: MATE family efflux transporter, partial [Hyphomonadaceae bacterium]
VVPFIGVAAWQMDGIFLGTTRGRALRTAGVAAMVLYIALDLALAQFGNTGVWSAFLMMYIIRAVCLGAFLPGLMRDIN